MSTGGSGARFGEWRVRHPRLHTALCVTIGVLSVSVASAGAYVISQSGKSTTVALDDVLEEFRSSTTVTEADPSSGGTVPPTGEDESSPTTTPAEPEVSTSGQDGPTATAPEPSAAPATTATTAAPPTAPTGFERPAEGVYTYAAKGGESISVAGARHNYGGHVYAAVTHTECGYRIVLKVLKEHVDTLDVCIQGPVLAFRSVNQRLTFIGNTDEGSMHCQTPMTLVDLGTPGQQVQAPCTAGSVKVHATGTHQGDTSVTLDGAEVPAHVARWEWRGTAGTSGSGWVSFTVDDHGLPLVWDRQSRTTSSSVLGRVMHQERATFTLVSRTPQR